MRTALLADIHSNLEALEACLAHARRRGVERFAFLGDLVGYGADPLACLDIIAGMVEEGALALRGNHDEACLGGQLEAMHFAARDAIYWTRERLGPRQREFLAGLPLTHEEGERCFAHAGMVDGDIKTVPGFIEQPIESRGFIRHYMLLGSFTS